MIESGLPSESPSHLLERVNFTVREFKEKAQQGEMTRDYHEAMEAIEVCACGCGLIHGEDYWGGRQHTPTSMEWLFMNVSLPLNGGTSFDTILQGCWMSKTTPAQFEGHCVA